MKSAVLAVFAILAASVFIALYQVFQLRNILALAVKDRNQQPVASLRLRFTSDPAKSCRGGTWKRVIVETSKSYGEPIFAETDALSYRFDGVTLDIGRNEICDAYFGFTGRLLAGRLNGVYYSFGEGGTRLLGYVVGRSE